MINTLDVLAAQEVKLYGTAKGLEGSMEAKEQWLKEAGIFDEYTKLHRRYFELLEQTGSADLQLEALKRLVFLNWYMYAEPSIYTEINELDEVVVAASYLWLDRYIMEGKLDQEFTWMLSYYSCWEYAILGYSKPNLKALTQFVTLLIRMFFTSRCTNSQ
ncbi:hypothetical protein MUN84_17780 [Hymenobacter sp. 5516J-16]|uniref:hypothetical protein n=1 Tax=Hymenobacter sp. 5516J-16 TaxID=2932253 RepID=UPI001FD43AC9|nr:hypothetical protein [Hymenobacter sp. 5516J-16]UOQ76386.1 hypothetical protein MUN84_17780 [Hymenobacter sp. 5516J-16]